MQASPPHRCGDTHDSTSGACNRGFHSNDPERQCEAVDDESQPQERARQFRHDLRRPPGAVRGTRAPADAQGRDAAPPPATNKRGR